MSDVVCTAQPRGDTRIFSPASGFLRLAVGTRMCRSPHGLVLHAKPPRLVGATYEIHGGHGWFVQRFSRFLRPVMAGVVTWPGPRGNFLRSAGDRRRVRGYLAGIGLLGRDVRLGNLVGSALRVTGAVGTAGAVADAVATAAVSAASAAVAAGAAVTTTTAAVGLATPPGRLANDVVSSGARLAGRTARAAAEVPVRGAHTAAGVARQMAEAGLRPVMVTGRPPGHRRARSPAPSGSRRSTS